MFVALSISDRASPDATEGKHTRAAETVAAVGGARRRRKTLPITYNNGELPVQLAFRLTLTLGTKGEHLPIILASARCGCPCLATQALPVDVKLDGKPAPVVAQNLLPAP